MKDLQYGCGDTERDDETADHRDADLPPSDLSRGILWDEF